MERLRDCDFALYRQRNLVERFFNKITHFRAIATRYDQLARNFLAAVQFGFGYHPPQLRTGPRSKLGQGAREAEFRECAPGTAGRL